MTTEQKVMLQYLHNDNTKTDHIMCLAYVNNVNL